MHTREYAFDAKEVQGVGVKAVLYLMIRITSFLRARERVLAIVIPSRCLGVCHNQVPIGAQVR